MQAAQAHRQNARQHPGYIHQTGACLHEGYAVVDQQLLLAAAQAQQLSRTRMHTSSAASYTARHSSTGAPASSRARMRSAHRSPTQGQLRTALQEQPWRRRAAQDMPRDMLSILEGNHGPEGVRLLLLDSHGEGQGQGRLPLTRDCSPDNLDHHLTTLRCSCCAQLACKAHPQPPAAARAHLAYTLQAAAGACPVSCT